MAPGFLWFPCKRHPERGGTLQTSDVVPSSNVLCDVGVNPKRRVSTLDASRRRCGKELTAEYGKMVEQMRKTFDTGKTRKLPICLRTFAIFPPVGFKGNLSLLEFF